MSHPPTIKSVLVTGAGELGTEVLRYLLQHPQRHETAIFLLVRSRSRTQQLLQSSLGEHLTQQIADIIEGDIVHDSDDRLVSIFRKFDLVIGCTGFVTGSGGTQIRLARAVLAASTPFYIPWQYGVDYDAVGRGSAQVLFDEQLDVRELLRAQSATKWAIVSSGLFMSFLFESFFGVVDLERGVVRALGGWGNRVTVTTAADIGRLTAELVLGADQDKLFTNRVVYIGGDTISYADLATLVEKVTRRPITREVLTVEQAQTELAQDPENQVGKYKVVFAQGRGVAWDLSATWNQQAGIHATTAEEWASRNL